MYARVGLVSLLFILALGGTLAAADSIVLYSQGIACINETRTVTLQPGENTIDLSVPSGLIPESLLIAFDGAVLSQSFHYTPPDALLSVAIGKEIEAVAQDGRVYHGTLLSTAGGVTLKDASGMVHILHDPIRISLPGSKALSPYLELRLTADKGGTVPIRLTYLSTGFGWSMSYVGALSADERSLSLTGWIRLENKTDYGLHNAAVRLIAGNLNQVKNRTTARVAPTALSTPIQAQPAFEYHLYTLPGTIDLPGGSSLILPYGSFSGIPVEKIYTYDGAQAPGVKVSLKFKNTKDGGLGIPLPAGDVRLFQTRDNGRIFIGADSIGPIPTGEEVTLRAGSAFDITGTRVRTESVKLSKSTYRDSYRITLRNHKNKAVPVNVLEHPSGNTWKITKSGISYKEGDKFVTVVLPYEKVDSHTVKFAAYVPAEGESEVTYTLEYSY